jgi:hypothetical protein
VLGRKKIHKELLPPRMPSGRNYLIEKLRINSESKNDDYDSKLVIGKLP